MFGWTAYGYLRIDVLWCAEGVGGKALVSSCLPKPQPKEAARLVQFAYADSFSFKRRSFINSGATAILRNSIKWQGRKRGIF